MQSQQILKAVVQALCYHLYYNMDSQHKSHTDYMMTKASVCTFSRATYFYFPGQDE